MSKSFNVHEVEALLTQCHRRCCICHRFCGVKIEIDHIDQKADSHDNTIENAIPVCFECHAEIHSYNDRHPRGRKFSSAELRAHREQWLSLCKERPEILVAPLSPTDVGPLQALIDELEFNLAVTAKEGPHEQGSSFFTQQFLRAINEGALAILKEELKRDLIEAYVAISKANNLVLSASSIPRESNLWGGSANAAMRAIKECKAPLTQAKERLLNFLAPENE